MENDNAEAQRHFKSLSMDEKLDELWFGMRELHGLALGMIERQDKTNGNVLRTTEGLKETNRELAVHLEMHKMEQHDVAFVKKWGGRGTGLVIAAIAVFGGGGGLLAIIDWVKG